jgi:hypothetical protein
MKAALRRQLVFIYFVFLVVVNLLDELRQAKPDLQNDVRMRPFLADSDSCLLLFGRPQPVGSRHKFDPASGFQPTTQIPNTFPTPTRNLRVNLLSQ